MTTERVIEPFLAGDSMFTHGITFGGHPVMAAIALKNIEIMKREGIVDGVREREAMYRSKLEQRLLAAVSDLQLAQKERDEYRDQMLRLNEAMLRYLKTSQGGDAQARMDVETQLRSTNQLVTRSTNAPESLLPSLMDGSVISVKDEWSFVVGNLGERQGVKIGMPMRVMRDDRKIATLRVVDVRQKICGAVIQEMDSEKQKIRGGDRLQVDAQPNVSLK